MVQDRNGSRPADPARNQGRGSLASGAPTADAEAVGPATRPSRLLTAVSAFNVLTNVATYLLILRLLGAGEDSDALFASQIVPAILVGIGVATIVPALTPMLATERNFAGAMTAVSGICLLTYLLFGCVLYWSAPLWLGIFFPGFDASALSQLYRLTDVAAVAMVFSALATLFVCGANAGGWFVLPQCLLAAGNLALLLGLLLLGRAPAVLHIALLMLARHALVALLVGVLLARYGYALPDAGFGGRLVQRMRPILGASVIYRTAPLIDGFFCSLAGAGAVTIFTLCRSIIGAAVQLMERSIIAPLRVELAQMHVREEVDRIRSRLQRIKATFNRLFVPPILAAGILVYLFPAEWGRRLDPILDYGVLLLALSGMFLGSLKAMLVNAGFFAMGNTRTPTRVGLYGFVLSIPLKYAGLVWFGLVGFSVAYSLHYLTVAWALGLTFAKATGPLLRASEDR